MAEDIETSVLQMGISQDVSTSKLWIRSLRLFYSTVLLEKLADSQLVKEFPAFYGTQRFLTAFTRWQFFYGDELLAARPISKPDDHLLSAVRDCVFNIFAATIHIAGRSSVRSLRTRHAMVTGTHLTRLVYLAGLKEFSVSNVFEKLCSTLQAGL